MSIFLHRMTNRAAPKGAGTHAVGSAPDGPFVSVLPACIMEPMQRNAPNSICVAGAQKLPGTGRLHIQAEAALRRRLAEAPRHEVTPVARGPGGFAAARLSVGVTFRPRAA